MTHILFILLFSFMICYADDCANSLNASKKIHVKIKNWANEISEKYQLNLLCGDGSGSLIDGKDETFWCSKFMVRGHQMKIEDMRPIAEAIYQSLWKLANNNKEFSEFLYYTAKMFPRYGAKLTPDNIGLRIDLWDENNDRYLFPYLSQVIITGKQAHYYYADPKTQALQKPGVVEELPSWVLKR